MLISIQDRTETCVGIWNFCEKSNIEYNLKCRKQKHLISICSDRLIIGISTKLLYVSTSKAYGDMFDHNSICLLRNADSISLTFQWQSICCELVWVLYMFFFHGFVFRCSLHSKISIGMRFFSLFCSLFNLTVFTVRLGMVIVYCITDSFQSTDSYVCLFVVFFLFLCRVERCTVQIEI